MSDTSNFGQGTVDSFPAVAGTTPMNQSPLTHSQRHTLEESAEIAVEAAMTSVLSVTASATATAWGHHAINAAGGNVTLTLPTGVGKVWVSATRTDSSTNTVTIACGAGQTFADGTTTLTLTGQNVGAKWHFDGTSKWIVEGIQPGAYASALLASGPPLTNGTSVGQVSVDSAGIIWVWSGSAWTMGGAGVELGEADLSSNVAGLTATTNTDIPGLSITFTAPARSFVIDLTVPLVSQTAAGNGTTLVITDSANVIVGQGSAIALSYLGGFYSSALLVRSRLPAVGGTNSYAITPGQSYTFKARYAVTAGTSGLLTGNGSYRPMLRAVTC